MDSKQDKPFHSLPPPDERDSLRYAEGGLYKTRNISQGDNMSVVDASLSASCREGMSFDVVSDTGGRFGACFLVPFLRNKRSEIEIKINAENVRHFRMEVTGYATRMQKAYFEFKADGEVIRVGEEMTSAVVSRGLDGMLEIKASFIPHQSRADWLYLFAWPGDSENAHSSCTFSAGALRYRIEPQEIGHDDFMSAKKVVRDGVILHVHVLQLFRSYLHIEFEISKPGAQLSGLWLIAPEAIETAQWWTCDPVQSSGIENIAPEGLELVARTPAHAIPSPMLLETLDVRHGWRGHCIEALYRDYRDVRYLDVEHSDARLRKLKLAAAFTDGALVTLPLTGDNPWEEGFRKEIMKIERYRISPGDGLPLFVEVGARGPHSSLVRKMIDGPYRYIGLDLSPGENVDLVGDAHLLSEAVGVNTAEVIYTYSVLEHLLAPIKFVLEANKTLKPGGLFIAHAPTCWPLHAEPWDYWRFSSHAWVSLLNSMTGFEILEVQEYGDASIVPTMSLVSGDSKMQSAPAPLFTSVIARKISDTGCEYAAWSPDLAVGKYD